jgi:acyl-CoA synthetase (AMP-forming)/AMP-acid ligase II
MRASTIADVIANHSIRNADDIACVFLGDRGDETGRIAYSELFKRAGSFATCLASFEERARVVIILPTSIAFPVVLLGCFLAGKIAVPLPIPNHHRVSDILGMLEDCRPSCIVTTQALKTTLLTRFEGTCWQSLKIFAVEEITFDEELTYRPLGHDEIALLQYTSGSTSTPKGVVIRHGNIMANQRMIGDAFGLEPGKTVVGWTPLHHDQGLIGNLLHSLYIGTQCVLMPPIAFLRSPLLWLRMISKYQAHTSGGPNFAYNFCVDRYQPSDNTSEMDLSSWKVAFNGAEPINASTIRRFCKTFEPHGFNPSAMFPCYGMAEATLFVSGGPAGEGAFFCEAEKTEALQEKFELVSSGIIHPSMSVLIQPVSGGDSPSGPRMGEICIAGPNVSSGYWDRKSEDCVFDSSTGIQFLKTGDLGFIHDGRLYVAGRKKELMIVRGRNIYPYDIEQTIVASHQHFQNGGCAVFSFTHDGRGEEVFAVQEVKRTVRHNLPYDEVAGMVRKNVVRQHDVMLKRLYFVAPGFLPRTTSGKIKRTQLAALLHLPTARGVLAEC